KTRIIGARSLQIAMGAPLLVKAKSNELDPIDLATREFVAGVIPMTVKRPLPKKVE
ncbi:MAG: DNA-directed RNA polymerase subunit K, partial [Candidatus Aenigmarchaeota archaeon]|nr:DNA-directed RNA polymerase subunit K [Candidatus Aenigmarchaeota archaeon]